MMRLLAQYEAAVRNAERTGLRFQYKLGSTPPTMAEVSQFGNEVDTIREKFRAIVAPLGGRNVSSK